MLSAHLGGGIVMIEMIVDSIRASLANQQRVLILKTRIDDRYLPVWIGPAEADAIAIRLQKVAVPRPLTHDLLGSVISALGAALGFIVICDLRQDVFYAKLSLNINGKVLEVDCRPSDAIALAVGVQAPIYVEESVLDKAGFTMDRESGRPTAMDAEARNSGKVSEEELKGLSVFRDFIEGLDMRDFDKGKK